MRSNQGTQQGHRRLQRGHLARSSAQSPLTTTAASPGKSKKEFAKAIVDYNLAIRLDPQHVAPIAIAADAWRRPRSTTRRSPISTRRSGSIRNVLGPTAVAPGSGPLVPTRRYRDGKKAVESAIKACELTAWKDAPPARCARRRLRRNGRFRLGGEVADQGQLSTSGWRGPDEGASRLKIYEQNQPVRDTDSSVIGHGLLVRATRARSIQTDPRDWQQIRRRLPVRPTPESCTCTLFERAE